MIFCLEYGTPAFAPSFTEVSEDKQGFGRAGLAGILLLVLRSEATSQNSARKATDGHSDLAGKVSCDGATRSARS